MSPQSNYWDRVAHEKRFSHPLRKNWLARYLDSQSRILDYGCGYGRSLTELSEAGYENVVGMDFSESMLTRCRVELPFSKVIRNDGRGLPLKAGCFDAVLLFAVLTCIPDGDEQRHLIFEIEQALRPGGIIYLSDLLVNDDARNRERYQRFAEGYKCYGVFELPEGVAVRHHQVEWIDELTCSFQRLEYEPFKVTTMNGNVSAAFQYLGRKLKEAETCQQQHFE
ncbi:MAG: class I SAM-dependent methyltransferase [Pyrinomonadaceae bacterium]